MSRIVFIGAVGRSGTTLLERTLATDEGVVALGEVVHLWHRGLEHNEPCGCDLPFGECPFWRAIGESAFGGWDQLDRRKLQHDRLAVDRNRYIPFLIAPWLAPPSFRASLRRHVDVLGRLYSAIGEIADESAHGAILIDSSKHPSYLFLLRRMAGHDVRLLHVVRDPRGVVNSWSRRVTRPETGEIMEQLGTARGCMRWITHNLLFQLAGLMGVPRRRMPYERFTDEPVELERAIDDLLGPGTSERHLAVQGATVTLGVDHTVSGNPMRFQRGTVVIRSDDAWRQAMGKSRRMLAGLVTTPLRQVYGR